MDYLMLLAAALLLAVFFALNRFYQGMMGTGLKAGLIFNALLGAFASLVFFALGGFSVDITAFSLIMAGAMTVLVMLYTLLGFRIMKGGGMALYSLFLMSGGMAVPYVWGLIFLNESFSWLRTVGLALVLLAIALTAFGDKREKIALTDVLMCVVVFFLNGFVSVISKVHQVENVLATVGTEQFVMLGGIWKTLISSLAIGVIMLIERKKRKTAADSSFEDIGIGENKKAKTRWRILIPVIMAAAAVDGVSYFLQLLSAKTLPATVQYPIMTGGGIILTALCGVLVFREKPTKRVILAVIISFVGTLMFL